MYINTQSIQEKKKKKRKSVHKYTQSHLHSNYMLLWLQAQKGDLSLNLDLLRMAAGKRRHKATGTSKEEEVYEKKEGLEINVQDWQKPKSSITSTLHPQCYTIYPIKGLSFSRKITKTCWSYSE